MKKIFYYVFAILLALLSFPLYLFVGIPNSTGDGGTLFVYSTFNIIVYEIIPLMIGLAFTALSYFLYFKKLPIKKSRWFLFFEIINAFLMGFLIYGGFFLWEASEDFFGSIILAFLSIVLFIVSLTPFAVRIGIAIKDKKKQSKNNTDL